MSEYIKQIEINLNGLVQKYNLGDPRIEEFFEDTNGHEYVDLDLPSGLLWAPIYVSSGDSYRTSTWNNALSVPQSTWGGSWRLPTKADCEELIANTVREGNTLRSKKSNQSITFPRMFNNGTWFYCWTSDQDSSNTNNAYAFGIGGGAGASSSGLSATVSSVSKTYQWTIWLVLDTKEKYLTVEKANRKFYNKEEINERYLAKEKADEIYSTYLFIDDNINPKINRIERDLYDKYIDLKVGDVILTDKGTKQLTACTAEELQQYKDTHTPIGVVVIPTSHNVYETGEAGVMSLCLMSYNTPNSGTNTDEAMRWGSKGLDTSLPDLSQSNEVSINGSLINYRSATYLPSDKFEYVQSPDPKAKWVSNSRLAPSPYDKDGEARNPIYYSKEKSSYNALSDFDGISNTKILSNLSGQIDWKTADILDNSKCYTSACCCLRFCPDGTKLGEWYLPAMGELGYIMPRWNVIESSIQAVIDAYGESFAILLSEFNYYWSSTESSDSSARLINTDNGNATTTTKNDDRYVRAFLRVKILKSSSNFYTKEEIEEKLEENINSIKRDIYVDQYNGYDYVDMGEAGIWAKANVGATEETDYGLFVQWGDNVGYTSPTQGVGFKQTAYKFSRGDYDLKTLTKYCSNSEYGYNGFTDDLKELLLEDDLARVKMGGNWCTPSSDDLKKLIGYCTVTKVDNYNSSGVNGILLTLKTDKTKKLFIPASGYFFYNNNYKTRDSSFLWCRNLTTVPNEAYCYDSETSMTKISKVSRAYGCPVRAILKPESKFYTKEEVDEKIKYPYSSLPDVSSLTYVDFCNYELGNIYMNRFTFNSKVTAIKFTGCDDRVVFAKKNDTYTSTFYPGLFYKWKWTIPSNITSLSGMFNNFNGVIVAPEALDTSKITSLSLMFYGYNGSIKHLVDGKEYTDTDVLDLSWIDASSCTNISWIAGYSNVTTINAAIKNMNKIESADYMFGVYATHRNKYYNSVTTVNLGSNFDLSSVINDSSNVFGCMTKLTTITGTFKWTTVSDLDVRYSPLTAESAMVLINGLPEIEDTHILYLKASTFNLLTDEQKAVATSKGWTITKV